VLREQVRGHIEELKANAREDQRLSGPAFDKTAIRDTVFKLFDDTSLNSSGVQATLMPADTKDSWQAWHEQEPSLLAQIPQEERRALRDPLFPLGWEKSAPVVTLPPRQQVDLMDVRGGEQPQEQADDTTGGREEARCEVKVGTFIVTAATAPPEGDAGDMVWWRLPFFGGQVEAVRGEGKGREMQVHWYCPRYRGYFVADINNAWAGIYKEEQGRRCKWLDWMSVDAAHASCDGLNRGGALPVALQKTLEKVSDTLCTPGTCLRYQPQQGLQLLRGAEGAPLLLQCSTSAAASEKVPEPGTLEYGRRPVRELTEREKDEMMRLWRTNMEELHRRYGVNGDSLDVTLENRSLVVVSARRCGRLAGFCVATQNGGTEYVYELQVGEGYRKRGVGTRLHMLAVGGSESQLQVFEGNSGARAFYSSLGYVEEEFDGPRGDVLELRRPAQHEQLLGYNCGTCEPCQPHSE
jgi:ribosomal protein S18 acetylase RimI-like enzyme